MSIHSTALIDERAEIDPSATIGAYAIVEGPVKIGARTRLFPHAYVAGYVTLGEDNQVHPFAVVGHEPQDRAFKGGESYLRIGDRNIIREHATIHCGTAEGSATVLGDDNFILASAHIGHNVVLGNGVTLASYSALCGHVHVGDRAFLSGGALVQQFTRIGRLVMMSGQAAVSKDIPPFVTSVFRNRVSGLNVVGLKRAGIEAAARAELRECFKILFTRKLPLPAALETIEAARFASPEVVELLEFCRSSKRGLCRYVKDSEETLVAQDLYYES